MSSSSQPAPAPMMMAIPKKKAQTFTSSVGGGAPSLMGAIPRKSSFTAPQPPSTMSTSRPPSQPLEYTKIPKKISSSSSLDDRQTQGLSATLSSLFPSQPSSYLPTEESKKSIPRKRQKLTIKFNKPPRNINGIVTVSEHPFVLKIPLHEVPLNYAITRDHNSRASKRKRVSYEELQDTDEEFLEDFGGDNDKKPFLKKSKKKANKSKALPLADSSAALSPVPDGGKEEASIGAVMDPNVIVVDAPPSGTLSTLWYSRECFLHIFVVEKILAWKTRPVSSLEWIPESLPEEGPPQTGPAIDPQQAFKWSNSSLTNPLIWSDPNKRMEVSRLLPEQCPIVMAMACRSQEQEIAIQPTDEEGKSKKIPKYRIKALAETEREEVYLVKWRGRSYMHASWERASDIVKYDQSKNTARNKIKRFVQSQEISFGPQWKKVLEEERSTTATIHAHGEQTTKTDTDAVEEDYYPPAVIEVERILACDESEMDMNLFAKQRALNIMTEQRYLKEKECGIDRKWNSKEGLADLLKELPWDPEDNVRYVVKWKGLPFAEMTWEYWRDIKVDAVTEAEDFWIRQRPPDEKSIQKSNRPHPHIRDFRKMQESPVFGISKIERPVADVGQSKEENTEDTDEGLRLRSYQLEGVNWLLFNWWNKRSCILADEMGLGKTIQSMCFLRILQDNPSTGVRGPFLIVAPLSLIGQWQSEARTWAPDLNVVLYHGSADARDFLVKQDFYYTDQFVTKPTAVKLKKQHVTKFHILITTYEVAMKDISVISKIRWRALIVDEAHRLKNPQSRLFSELGAVPRDYCILLTGTPLANATEELWALLHFADKSAFASKDNFLDQFGQLTNAEQVKELHSVLKPYLLRRVKEDVEKSLPPKEETILEVSLTPVQKKFYKAIYERNTAFLHKGAKPSNSPSLMNVMMELRKCCNHPYLVRGAEERILKDAASQIESTGDDGANVDWKKLFEEQLIKSSGKMVLINKLLPKLFANGHKVLIFSQMVRVLDLLEDLLKIKKYKYERLDGSTSSSSRAAAVDRFIRKSCQRFVMLLSTRAGGLGLNLTAADVVIIFDSDWNPQNDLQAMARAHRIGQTRAVRVYRLLTAKTYEMHMFHSASMKLGLERAVLSHQREQSDENEGGKPNSKSTREAQAREIDSLLKKGAYDVFRDDDDAEAQEFMETDIDQLLESSATTVTYGATQSNLSSGLGSFSKASFVADTGDGEKDVDLDDPDFWTKAVGLEKPVETPEEIAQMLDDGVKRSRKQVQVFDPYAEFMEMEQRREDKIAQKKLEEKEEKERLRLQKKKQREDEKERKRKAREERDALKAATLMLREEEQEEINSSKKQIHEAKLKKLKKASEKKQSLSHTRVRNPDSWVRQAWDVPQRHRAIAACLRFGFERFCRIRFESNLTSLPIQDFEVFFRSYFYQLSLQAAVTFLQLQKNESQSMDEYSMKNFLHESLGNPSSKEVNWLCDCLSNGLRHYIEVKSNRRCLRVPRVLAEPVFVADLRSGPALRSLRRMFMLCRIKRIIEDCLDELLSQLGYEQLAKRGCHTSDISTLDVDLKSRLVSTEEISLALNAHMGKIDHRSPVAWWDRSCDIALLIGTFVHGLGNYDAMLNDNALPFDFKIQKFAKKDEACLAAQKSFDIATSAARKVFDSALVAFDAKEEERNIAIISAAAANQNAREKDAQLLREGGAAADIIHSKMPDQVAKNRYEVIDGDDSHYVTLPRLKEGLLTSIRQDPGTIMELVPLGVKSQETPSGPGRRKVINYHQLLMPDARVLDCRLTIILEEIEQSMYESESSEIDNGQRERLPSLWQHSETVWCICEARRKAISRVSGVDWNDQSDQPLREYMGIGIRGSQCAASHKLLDDGTDFSVGAASLELAQVASPTARYLRDIGVPMNLTRFALSALVYADRSCVDELLEIERARSLAKNESDPKVGESTKSDEPPTANRETDHPQNENVKSELDVPEVTTVENVGSSIMVTEAQKIEGKSEEIVPKEDGKESMDVSPVPESLKDPRLRASICLVLLYYGYPHANSGKSRVSKPLWDSTKDQESDPDHLFDDERFRGLLEEFVWAYDDDCHFPDIATIKRYVESCLLPHCLRLCVMGNGPVLSEARGSSGKYTTAYGTSLYPEHTEYLQSPLPDPCLDLSDHSIQALGAASAILRRHRMMRAAMKLASGAAPLSQIDKILHSSFIRKSMEGLPVWWCPWIHDAALLVHASTKGLFSIVKDRKSEECSSSLFSHKGIVKHIHSTFIAGDGLPRSIVEQSSFEDSSTWVELQARDFPSMNVLERRLAFLCSQASEFLNEDERYDNLPMFDHGSWPRN